MILKPIIFTTTLFASQWAFADSHSGKISRFHLNSKATARGVCIRMEPEINVGNKWACLNDKNMHLYTEMTSLLLTGYTAKKICTIYWDQISGNGAAHANINIAECD